MTDASRQAAVRRGSQAEFRTRRTGPARSFASRLTRSMIALALAGLIGSVGIWLENKGFAVVDTFDKHVGDLPIAYGSTIAKGQRRDVAVVLIEEETIAAYETRSPVDRRLIAELVRAIDSAGPKAIGVTFTLDRTTAHDADFVKALRDAKSPVVMAALDQRSFGLPGNSLRIQSDLLRQIGRPFGHPYFVRKASVKTSLDGVVRSIAEEDPKQPVPAFADVLAKAAGRDHRPSSNIIAWLRPPDDQTPVFPELTLAAHAPGQMREAVARFMSPSIRDFLRDRIVLIGANLADTLPTPLPLLEWGFSDAVPFPVPHTVIVKGTVIHAHAVAQRMDGNRDIWSLRPWQAMALVGLTALACFALARARHVSPQGLAYNAIGLVVVCVGCLAAYKLALLELPSIALATAWALGGAAGSIAGVVYKWLGVPHETTSDV